MAKTKQQTPQQSKAQNQKGQKQQQQQAVKMETKKVCELRAAFRGRVGWRGTRVYPMSVAAAFSGGLPFESLSSLPACLWLYLHLLRFGWSCFLHASPPASALQLELVLWAILVRSKLSLCFWNDAARGIGCPRVPETAACTHSRVTHADYSP